MKNKKNIFTIVITLIFVMSFSVLASADLTRASTSINEYGVGISYSGSSATITYEFGVKTNYTCRAFVELQVNKNGTWTTVKSWNDSSSSSDLINQVRTTIDTTQSYRAQVTFTAVLNGSSVDSRVQIQY